MKLITKHEVAEKFSVSPETIYRYRRSGKLIEGIHWIRINDRTIRYFEDTIDHFIKYYETDLQRHLNYIYQYFEGV